MRSTKNYKKWFCLFCAVSLVLLISSCGDDDDKEYLSDVSGNWRFLGTLSSNDCVAFSYLPIGTPFDLFLQLTQNGKTVTGQKTGGLLWSERPIEECLVSGTYDNNEINLDAQFVNTQPVTSPPFVFPEGVTSSECILEIRGDVEIFIESEFLGSGGVNANVTQSPSGGSCDEWLQPIPCQMKITGTWTKLN